MHVTRGGADTVATFDTISGREIKPFYTAGDLPNPNGSDGAPGVPGVPGAFPFTRGIHADMYRGRLWTMRQFAGFGSAEDTNQRFRFLLDKGQTGLSVAFDMPTLMGLDSDDPRARGEVGRLGVAIDCAADMQRLFDSIDLARVSTSMTINAPAPILMAFYLVAAERQGIAWDKLGGTLQNDTLKEFHAQNEFVFPPEPSVRLAVDVIEFCARHAPRWHPVSISGYHIREAGSTAGQELAFTLIDGIEYVERALQRGLKIDDFAPRLSFFFNAHNEFFEEIAKFRAARRIWARRMRDHYGAKNEASWRLRFHAQTAGCSLQAQQPGVNLIRVAYQAMAAVLGGCQSLHTNSMDETLSLPTEESVTLALRTQQVLAHETGVTSTADPLGGSYYVEALTDELEKEAETYFARIAEMGGVVRCVESGYFRREIASAAARYQREVESRKRVIVGVNDFIEPPQPIPTHKADPSVEPGQIERLRTLKAQRDPAKVAAALDRIRASAAGSQNLMPAFIDAARLEVTVGEMMSALADVLGRYKQTAGWW
ncbi:MAG: methylmalonyl-CoA mutase [Planctomycetes bacterium]|nr:methylmalonyl-CoA mutase [Planctomycetota bacterium]